MFIRQEKKYITIKSTFQFCLRSLIVVCFLFSFSALAQNLSNNNGQTSTPAQTNTTNTQTNTTNTQTSTANTQATNSTTNNQSSTSTKKTTSSNCSSSGCAKMYPADDISQLHHKYESAGNPCAFNKCAAGDTGGCSYGSSQLACSSGSLKEFLVSLQKSNPTIWKQLGGGNVSQMNARACTKPATDFANKWKSICKTSSAQAFAQAQEQYMKKAYYDKAAAAIKREYGVDFNSRSPELQMALFSAAVALGSPGGAKNLMNSIKKNIGDPAKMTDEELLQAMYKRRDYFYGSSSPSIRASVQKRNAREGAEALESLKIRQAWEAEQQKPADQRKSYEEVVKEVTGKEACAGGQSGKFECSASGATSDGGSGGGEDVSANNDGYGDKDCSPSRYKLDYGGCMMCPLFTIIFNTASKIAKLTFDKLALPVVTVVLVAWALWIATQILMFVSSFKTKDAPTLIVTLLNKSFVVLIAVLFLQADSGTFFGMLMEPIFDMGYKLVLLTSPNSSCNMSGYTLIQDGGLPLSMGQNIICIIQAIQQKLVDTLSLGAASICVAFYIKGVLFIFPSFTYLISGVLIFIGAAIVIVIFPFLLIDSVFQLTVACALLPAAIGAYPFNLTRKYVTKVWDIFMNSVFNFVFMSLVIYILTGAIENTIMEGGVNKINDSNFQETIITTFVWGGVTLIKIVFILLLTWVILEEVNSYASRFAPSMVPDGAGRDIGGMAAKGAKDLGKKAYGGAKKVGGAIAETAKEKIGDMRRNAQIQNLQKHGTEQLITDKEGNVIGRSYTVQGKSWARGRDKAQTLTIMNNGTKMIESSKDYGNGKVVTTRSDGYLKQVQTTKKDEKTGKISVISSNLEIQTAGLRAARNKDGSMNMTSLNIALKNSAFSEKMIKAAALRQYAAESGIKFPENVSEENINITQDEEGREVVEIVNNSQDGPSQTLKMHMPENENSGRVLVESIHKDKEGNEVQYATDGMINRKRIIQLNKKTGKYDKSERYALSDYYAQRTQYGIDYDGNFANIFSERGGMAYSLNEQEKIRKYLLKRRQKSQPSRIGELR